MSVRPKGEAWPARFTPFATTGRSYDLRRVDLLAADSVPDVFPTEPTLLEGVLRSLARDAIIYGLPAALQYANMYRAVVATGAPGKFNVWRHGRDLATPAYTEFRTPNVDTLYSTAWLDLTGGPIELAIPPIGDRYYTVNLLDAHSNSVNLSTRTLGPAGGRVWVVNTDWEGDAAEGVRIFRVSTRYVWVLMRLFVRSAADVETVRRIQDQVEIRAIELRAAATNPRPWPQMPTDDALNGASVLCALDEVLYRNGHPIQEQAYLSRFKALGIGCERPVDHERWSPEVRAAVDSGYRDAMELIRSVIALRGRPAGTSGWRTLSSGAYGYNYLHRAATNYVGLGATTRDESGPYTALVDSHGRPLDGRHGSYHLRFSPPPVDAFWSMTAYDLESRTLVPNELQRYSINSRADDLEWAADGTLSIYVGTTQGPAGTNWLPVPPAPFYLVVRAYLGAPAVIDGTWAPCPVVRTEMSG